MNEELQRINLDDYVQTGEGGNGKIRFCKGTKKNIFIRKKTAIN